MARTQPLDSHCQPCGNWTAWVNRASRPMITKGMYALRPADAARPVPVSASSTHPASHRHARPARGGGYALRVRLVIAKCSVDYVGRLSAHLPPAVRLLMVRAEGSVSIHADARAYKPLNWMSPPCRLQEAPGVWKVVNKAGEELRITLEEIFQ